MTAAVTVPARRRAVAAGAVVLPPAALAVLAEIGYPLVHGPARVALTAVAVVASCAASLAHAALTRGPRVAAALLLTFAVGGWLVDVVGEATGVPFGRYRYAGTLGPAPLGVPLLVGLAWCMAAWPAWVVALHLAPGARALHVVPRVRALHVVPGVRALHVVPGVRALHVVPGVRALHLAPRWAGAARVTLAATALAAWDLFLDPQMVAEGHWVWRHPHPALPGVPGVPLSNYAGWLLAALLMAAAFGALAGRRAARPGTASGDAVPLGLYLWTYGSSVLAHAAFFGLPGSALWGGVGMGLVAVPLAVVLARRRDHR